MTVVAVAVSEHEDRRRDEECAAWYRERVDGFSAFRDAVDHLVRVELLRPDGPAGAGSAVELKQVQSITPRVKTLASLQEKWRRRLAHEPSRYKYTDPAEQITDVVGLRVVVYLTRAAEDVGQVITSAFTTTGKEARTEDLSVPGYLGDHYLVGLTEERLRLRENAGFEGMLAEVQVQTVLQHAWAEIQHDVLYKGDLRQSKPLLHRRLTTVAGLLQLADEQFTEVFRELEPVRSATEREGGLALDEGSLLTLLEEHVPGDGPTQPERVAALLPLLQQLELADAHALTRVLAKRAADVDAVVPLLRRTGYRPGRVEIADALLRVELGELYLNRRSGWEELDADARQRARASVSALRAAAEDARV